MTSLAAETTKATVEIKVDAAKLDLAVKKLLQDMASISDSVDKKVEAAQAATDKSLTKAAADAAAAAKTAKDAATAAAKQASADAEKSKAEIKKIVEVGDHHRSHACMRCLPRWPVACAETWNVGKAES